MIKHTKGICLSLAIIFLSACGGSSEETQSLSDLFGPTVTTNQGESSDGIRLLQFGLHDKDMNNKTSLSVQDGDEFFVSWETNYSSYSASIYLLQGSSDEISDSTRIINNNCGLNSNCPSKTGLLKCEVETNRVICDKKEFNFGNSKYWDSNFYNDAYIGIRVCDSLFSNCQISKLAINYESTSTAAISPTITSPNTSSNQQLIGNWDFTDTTGWTLHNVEILNGMLHLDGIYTASFNVFNKENGEYAMAHIPNIDFDSFTIGVRVNPYTQEKRTPLIVLGQSRWLFLQENFAGEWVLFFNNYEQQVILENVVIDFDSFNEVIIFVDRVNKRLILDVNSQLFEFELPENLVFFPETKPKTDREICDLYSCDLGVTFLNYSSGYILKGEVDSVFVANGALDFDTAKQLLR